MAKLIAPGTLALSLLLAASTATAQEEATSPAEGVRRTVVLVLDLEAIGVDEG